MRLFVTTAYTSNEQLEQKALQLAQELGCLSIPRNRRSIARILQSYEADQVLVVTSDGMDLHMKGSTGPLRFHPGMAYLRVQRLLEGVGDPLVAATGAQPGDHILDCTAGLASDAIVLAHVVGEAGSVVALESEVALARLVQAGLRTYESMVAAVDEAMRRVELRLADHRTVLAEMKDDSVDVVYFDPMFRTPVLESAVMEPLRAAANPSPLTEETIDQARRVAKRCVVLKELAASGEFARLGFETIRHKDGKIAYGVMYA